MRTLHVIQLAIETEDHTATQEQETRTIQQIFERTLRDNLGAKVGPHGEKGSFYLRGASILSVLPVRSWLEPGEM